MFNKLTCKKLMKIQTIQNRIYEIRGYRVMLDFDMAELYEVNTKSLKQAVRRNPDRFPPDFMFELNADEVLKLKEKLRSQSVTSSSLSTGYAPFAFTEQGVAMLASVLKSRKAIEVNIQIVRAFVFLRQYTLTHKDLAKRLSALEGRFTDVSQAINYLLKKDKQEIKHKERKPVGYKIGKDK
jgi:hypothetical protein